MSSCKSRKLKQKRRYQRTQATITSGSNFRFQNNGGRHDLIGLRYQIPCCNTSLEMYELWRHFTVAKTIVGVANVLIVWYLVRRVRFR
jgi:hypothetical protein